jgi:hypothetical protein
MWIMYTCMGGLGLLAALFVKKQALGEASREPSNRNGLAPVRSWRMLDRAKMRPRGARHDLYDAERRNMNMPMVTMPALRAPPVIIAIGLKVKALRRPSQFAQKISHQGGYEAICLTHEIGCLMTP